MLLSPHKDEIVKLFEELGFEIRHQPTGIDNRDVSNTRMKDAGGFHVDVANASDMEHTMMVIRMNVDNFEEALDFLTARGFQMVSPHVVESESSKSVLLSTPYGLAINLCQHLK